jgi:hypothetical protein
MSREKILERAMLVWLICYGLLLLWTAVEVL